MQFKYDDRLFASKIKQEDSIYKLKNRISELELFNNRLIQGFIGLLILTILVIFLK